MQEEAAKLSFAYPVPKTGSEVYISGFIEASRWIAITIRSLKGSDHER
jgi:hypothetical protein